MAGKNTKGSKIEVTNTAAEQLRRVWLARVKPPVALTPLTVDWVGPV